MSAFLPREYYWIAVSKLYLSPKKLKSFFEHFNDIKLLFALSQKDFKMLGFNEKEIAPIKNLNWNVIESDFKQCEKLNCHIVSFFDKAYPERLREISGPPLVLYVRGNVKCLSDLQLAIVGTRNPTKMAFETAEKFANHLAKIGLVITSGLALGIDAAGHRGALLNEGGKTIAVMGTGVNQIYPPSHQKLAEEIIEKGALISEFPPDEKPKAKNFPRRNRVISGLSVGTLVVEAALHSGSLITARLAAEQGREVFAIPGSIHNPLARGCHFLLRQGAKLVETAEDIIEELGPFLDGLNEKKFQSQMTKLPDNMSEIHGRVLTQIGFETTAYDTIIVRSGLTASEVSSILLSLELSGFVSGVSGGYIRNP